MRTRTVVSSLVVACVLAGLALAAQPGQELAIGAKGPDFNLKGTDGEMHSLAASSGAKGTAVIFTCNECPYSKGYEDRLIELAKGFAPKGIGFIAINANDPKIVPGDGFEQMVQRAKDKGLPYPYVVDETQQVAVAYGARVTPHIFLLDSKGVLVYRGRVDDSLKSEEVKARDFKTALDALSSGKPVPVAETKAFGCSVKYSKGAA
ncbi:MAG TPA: thioredoxin family protein [Candidatus Cryosericum sp.]|nr:thioredoxin family protein [Candidatus Cryosericum sp.]